MQQDFKALGAHPSWDRIFTSRVTHNCVDWRKFPRPEQMPPNPPIPLALNSPAHTGASLIFEGAQ